MSWTLWYGDCQPVQQWSAKRKEAGVDWQATWHKEYAEKENRNYWRTFKMIMEKATTNIKDPKARAYFDDVTEGKKPAVQLTAEEYEQGINEFDDGMRKIIAEADEMIFRAKLGDLPEALSFSYIAQKYFGKSRGWLMQKVNGNKVNGKIASFTDEERRQFREALQDLSEKMTAVAITL